MKDSGVTATGFLAGTGGGGISVAFSTFLGVDIYTIAWALIGGVAGEARVDRKSWYLTLLQFLTVSLLAALAATVIWSVMELKSDVGRHGLAAFFSFYFYPLTQRLTVRLGTILDGILHRVFGSVPKPDDKGDDNVS